MTILLVRGKGELAGVEGRKEGRRTVDDNCEGGALLQKWGMNEPVAHRLSLSSHLHLMAISVFLSHSEEGSKEVEEVILFTPPSPLSLTLPLSSGVNHPPLVQVFSPN